MYVICFDLSIAPVRFLKWLATSVCMTIMNSFLAVKKEWVIWN